MKKKAQNLVEISFIFALIAVVSIGAYTGINTLKTKLVDMSATKTNTAPITAKNTTTVNNVQTTTPTSTSPTGSGSSSSSPNTTSSPSSGSSAGSTTTTTTSGNGASKPVSGVNTNVVPKPKKPETAGINANIVKIKK